MGVLSMGGVTVSIMIVGVMILIMLVVVAVAVAVAVMVSCDTFVAINWGGGKNTHSVLSFGFSAVALMCILSPNRAEWWYMRFIP